MTELKLTETQIDPKEIALLLFRAMMLPDEEVFPQLDEPKYTAADYTRMACHLFAAACGTCCQKGDPIRLRRGCGQLARSESLNNFVFVREAGVLDFKHILPCKFYDRLARGCKIYAARPWSCRIFPFLGVYGSSDHVVVNPSCPGSVETMRILTGAMEEVQREQEGYSPSIEEIRRSKEKLRSALGSI